MIWSAIAYASSDRILLPLFELGIAAAVAYTKFREVRAHARAEAPGSSSLSVERGEQSQHTLAAVYYYGVFVVVFFIPLSVQTSHKVLLSLFNTFSATYLCFFGGWSRLKIFELVTRFSNRQEWA